MNKEILNFNFNLYYIPAAEINTTPIDILPMKIAELEKQ